MKKRILSLLLILCMTVTLLPTAVFAEDATGTSSAGGTIYVDAVNGNDSNENVGQSWETAYKTLETAVTAAKSGDTIMLSAAKYTLYGIPSTNTTKGKDLTFVGQGADKTGWNIGAAVPDPANFGTEYNGDYSFDGAKTITFKGMTLQSAGADYLGFIRADQTVVENCTINGKTFYWGYTSAMFKDTTFNCPSGDYAVWTYSSPTMTFDHCTFNSSGKVINVYTDFGAGKQDITVNFKNCTVNNTGKSLKPVLNINDSNMGNFKYILNISGNTTVTGVDADKDTCSRLFGFGGKAASNNKGKTVVNFGDTTVWEDGKMVDAEAYHNEGVTVNGVTYDNDVDGANDSLYAEGYKDNAFTITYSEWTKNPDGTQSREGTKTCNYCKYHESYTETKDADPIDWDVSKSKTATKLDTNTWTSNVTLSLPSAEEALGSDIVFVLDASDCAGKTMEVISYLVNELKTAQDEIGANIKVGAIIFNGSAYPMFDGKLVDAAEAIEELTKLSTEATTEKEVWAYFGLDKNPNYVNKGSNLHAGLRSAQKLLDSDDTVAAERKYLVAVTDGMTYYWNDEQDNVYGIYSQSTTNGLNYPTLLFYAWCEGNNVPQGSYTLPTDFVG